MKKQIGQFSALTLCFAPLFGLLSECREGHAQSAQVNSQQPNPVSPAQSTPDAGLAGSIPVTGPASPREPNGNDDGEEVGNGTLDLSHTLVPTSVGRAPGGLRRICDLTVFQDALFVAAANSPLGSDGAVISRFQPTPNDNHNWTMGFDWNRPGQPTQGGAGGQGFVRVHNIGDRLYVPDADPPYGGFGITGSGTDGFVFVSDAQGRFQRARGATLRPPSIPNAQGYFGAGVLPRAYHVLDVLKFRGRMYASTGSVAPGQRAWYGASPGALHVANERLSRWTYAVDYPRPYQNGVWRLTFMTRFQGALYAGIQDYDGREPNDFVVIRPPNGEQQLAQAHMSAQRVSPRGGSLTLRWYTDRGRLFWIELQRGAGVYLHWTSDGQSWRTIELPVEAGAPSDITRFRDSLVILTENGLYKIADSLDPATLRRVGTGPTRPAEQRAFAVTDAFCASPLAVYRNALYAGSQLGSRLYRFE